MRSVGDELGALFVSLCGNESRVYLPIDQDEWI